MTPIARTAAGLLLALSACTTLAPDGGRGRTAAAIREADLRARLFALADDSMQGREIGTPGHERAVEWVAREAARLGMQPAGDGGTFFQTVPLTRRSPDPASTLHVGDAPLEFWTDFAFSDQRRPLRAFAGAPVIFGGTYADSTTWITAEQARGRVVVFVARPTGPIRIGTARFSGAAALLVTGIDSQYADVAAFLKRPSLRLPPRSPATDSAAANIYVPTRVAERFMGAPLAGMTPGTLGQRPARGTLQQRVQPMPIRNVVAMIPGSDPALRGQYVLFSSHTDHDGIRRAEDHDSVRIYNRVLRFAGRRNNPPPTPEQLARLRAELDSVRAIRPSRLDSIMNGADDNGTASVALLEIAEAYAARNRRPARSTLFVWHTGEEPDPGLIGSTHYSTFPTVPRDSIVAVLNADLIGRGGAGDIENGGPDYLHLIGTRRLASELNGLVEGINRQRARPFSFDYSHDVEGHPQAYYCRSDHYSYARYGIPVAFFTTGTHGDYHRVTDEAQYIDYAKLTRITQLMADVGLGIANLDHRLVVDQPRPDPQAPCR